MTTPHNISPQQANEWLATGEAVLIDVREPDEFKGEHIAYALSLPLSNVHTTFQQLELSSRHKVIFQCARGKRGEQACSIISKNTDCAIHNIEGGLEAWKNAGLPIISSSNAKLSIFRQVQIIVGALVLIMVLLGFLGQMWAFALAGVIGAALATAGLTGWCGLAILLAKAPWNKP